MLLPTCLRIYGTLYLKRAFRMATKKQTTPAKPKQSRKASARTDTRVPLTLKVDEKTYVRLCTLHAKLRKTNQEILNEALLEHLKRLGA
jgi:hypothetical protein